MVVGLYGNNSHTGECLEESNRYAQAYAQLLEDGKYEELGGLLFSWENACEMSEPMFRARALQLIEEGMFPGILARHDMLDLAIAFEIRYQLIETQSHESRQEYYDLYPGYFGYVPLNSRFDRQTRQMAQQLKQREGHNEMASLFLKLYTGETQAFFEALQQKDPAHSMLHTQYAERVAYFRGKPEFNMGVQAGAWFPFDDLSAIGTKPSLGITLGVKWGGNHLDGVFEFRFGNTPERFGFMVQDTLVHTRKYLGGYAGFEYSRLLFSQAASRWELFGALGYDIIEMTEDKRNPEKQFFGSMVFAAGPSYRYVFPNRSWINVRVGYQLLNHSHEQGTPLGGNAVAIRIVYGFWENARKTQNLKRLGVTDW